jgi:hypothetical protein
VTQPDVPPTVPAPAFAPAVVPPPPRRPSATLAIIALVVAASLTLLYLIVKLVAVSINPDFDSDSTRAIASVLGVLGLLTILPALAVVVMGHLALRRRRDGATPGRALAGVALGLGYFHMLMWGNRVLLALVIATQSGDFSTFVADVFWWA